MTMFPSTLVVEVHWTKEGQTCTTCGTLANKYIFQIIPRCVLWTISEEFQTTHQQHIWNKIDLLLLGFQLLKLLGLHRGLGYFALENQYKELQDLRQQKQKWVNNQCIFLTRNKEWQTTSYIILLCLHKKGATMRQNNHSTRTPGFEE